MGTLLIIDDSIAIRKKLISVLESTGDFARFLEARDGLTALKIMTDDDVDVDVVACDFNMPRMNGYQFLKSVRTRPEFTGIPIVMVTSKSEDIEMVKAFELGANDFIVKPFSEAILRARLKNMLHMKRLQDQLKKQKEKMEQITTTDHLTNIPNLRGFRENLGTEFRRAKRYGGPLSILLLDLDHFKRINDTYGHPQGDCVLRESAEVIVRIMRKLDLVARYGGEEFVVIMPHTGCEGAARMAERFSLTFEEHTFAGLERKGVTTISIGVATYYADMEMDADGLVGLADRALYAAKRGGRNRVEISPESVK